MLCPEKYFAVIQQDFLSRIRIIERFFHIGGERNVYGFDQAALCQHYRRLQISYPKLRSLHVYKQLRLYAAYAGCLMQAFDQS